MFNRGQVYVDACRLIFFSAEKMKIKNFTRAQAQILFHRTGENVSEYFEEVFIHCAACLFLSCKIDETPIKASVFADVFCLLVFKEINPEKHKRWKDRIITTETEILYQIGFNYTPFVSIYTLLFSKLERCGVSIDDEIYHKSICYLDASLLTPLCVLYGYEFNIEIVFKLSIEENNEWNEEFEKIKKEIKTFYIKEQKGHSFERI